MSRVIAARSAKSPRLPHKHLLRTAPRTPQARRTSAVLPRRHRWSAGACSRMRQKRQLLGDRRRQVPRGRQEQARHEVGVIVPPGATRQVIGYVRFRNDGPGPRSVTLRAGIVQEYVRYHVQDAGATTITITPERREPDAASYDAMLEPLARVYRLGAIPDKFLARTRNPRSSPRRTGSRPARPRPRVPAGPPPPAWPAGCARARAAPMSRHASA